MELVPLLKNNRNNGNNNTESSFVPSTIREKNEKMTVFYAGPHQTLNLLVSLNLDLPASKSVGDRFLLFISHPVYGILL